MSWDLTWKKQDRQDYVWPLSTLLGFPQKHRCCGGEKSKRGFCWRRVSCERSLPAEKPSLGSLNSTMNFQYVFGFISMQIQLFFLPSFVGSFVWLQLVKKMLFRSSRWRKKSNLPRIINIQLRPREELLKNKALWRRSPHQETLEEEKRRRTHRKQVGIAGVDWIMRPGSRLSIEPLKKSWSWASEKKCNGFRYFFLGGNEFLSPFPIIALPWRRWKKSMPRMLCFAMVLPWSKSSLRKYLDFCSNHLGKLRHSSCRRSSQWQIAQLSQ